MWADVDTKSDFLNYSEVADLVVDVIRDPSMRPVTIPTHERLPAIAMRFDRGEVATGKQIL